MLERRPDSGRYSERLFFEVKGTAYTIPAVRLYLGYTFK